MRRVLSLVVKVGLAALLIGYLAQSDKIQGKDLAAGFRAPGALAFAAVAIGFTVACASIRWRLLLRAVDVDLPWRAVLQLTLIGNFFNTFLPGSVGGDPVKAIYATRAAAPGRKVEAATTVVIDRALGLGTLVLLSLLAVVLLPLLGSGDAAIREALGPLARRFAPVFIALGILGAAALVGLFVPAVRRAPALQRLVERLPASVVLRRIARTLTTSLSHRTALAGAVVFSALAHLSTIAVFVVIGRVLGPVPTLGEHLFVVPVGLTINAVPGPPAGFGVGELAFETLYNLVLRTDASNGAEICLLWRMVQTCWNLVGGVAYVLYRRP